MGSDLKIWVSDKLMSLVGYSQSTLVQYIISLSKKAKSPADIADALKDDLSGCSVAELQAFSRELFAKADRGRPAPNVVPYKKKRRVWFVNSIPKSAAGKILIMDLRKVAALGSLSML